MMMMMMMMTCTGLCIWTQNSSIDSQTSQFRLIKSCDVEQKDNGRSAVYDWKEAVMVHLTLMTELNSTGRFSFFSRTRQGKFLGNLSIYHLLNKDSPQWTWFRSQWVHSTELDGKAIAFGEHCWEAAVSDSNSGHQPSITCDEPRRTYKIARQESSSTCDNG